VRRRALRGIAPREFERLRSALAAVRSNLEGKESHR
jgi:hypothetical protein